MYTKIFLAIVGLMYLGLSLWCSLAPTTTSDKVGFDLKSGSGQSEFFVIYGGLELGMALFFLLPLVKGEYLAGSLMACLIIHACLVAFRTVSFFLYSDISSMTYKLAIGEWIILLASLACFFLNRPET